MRSSTVYNLLQRIDQNFGLRRDWNFGLRIDWNFGLRRDENSTKKCSGKSWAKKILGILTQYWSGSTIIHLVG